MRHFHFVRWYLVAAVNVMWLWSQGMICFTPDTDTDTAIVELVSFVLLLLLVLPLESIHVKHTHSKFIAPDLTRHLLPVFLGYVHGHGRSPLRAPILVFVLTRLQISEARSGHSPDLSQGAGSELMQLWHSRRVQYRRTWFCEENILQRWQLCHKAWPQV